MMQGSGKRRMIADEQKGSNKRSKPNQDNTVDPALVLARDSTNVRSEPSTVSQNVALGFPEGTRMSRSAARHFLRQEESLRGASGSHQETSSSTVQEPRAVSSILPSKLEADASTPKGVNTRSSKKRTRVDARLESDAGEDLQDTKSDSRRSTRPFKRVRATPEYNDNASDDRDKKIRKTSKLKAKIAAGKGPQRGSLAPNGEVRIKEDGKMEFRDVNNPEWILAAYHNDYHRQFLDEAARDGQFYHTPTRGEANDDETSYQPEQQSWGPERADWQNITDSEGVKVMFEIDKPKTLRPPVEPSTWIHNGLVLLDNKNHPVKDWPGLNKTLSSEIESWRWEALTRIYPWLTVADLLARMPHTRKYKGKVVPLQTPQAFTNRAYRFRLPNQIPASKMKNGSATYKLQIIKNLEEQNAKTTETLSTLNSKQIEEVRKANKGKFKQNSRYVAKKDVEPRKTPPSSEKRKARRADDTESETEQKEPKAEKLHLPTPYMMGGLEAAVGGRMTPAYVYDDMSGNEGDNYNAPTRTSGSWQPQEQDIPPASYTEPRVEQSEEGLVPLFATIDDQSLALTMDDTFTSPSAVIWARRHGHQLTEFISVNWYRQSTPRHVGEDGMLVEDVVHEAFQFDVEAREPIPSITQPSFQFNQPINAVSQDFLAQAPNDIPVTAVTHLYEPSHGVYPDIPVPIPYDSSVAPAMGLDESSYDFYQDTLGQTVNGSHIAPATGPYVPSHGVYPDVLTEPPNNPPVAPLPSYAPTHGVYPNILRQPQIYPPVTPVTNLNAPLPFQNQIGRYQTDTDTSEEVWRNHYGSTGF